MLFVSTGLRFPGFASNDVECEHEKSAVGNKVYSGRNRFCAFGDLVSAHGSRTDEEQQGRQGLRTWLFVREQWDWRWMDGLGFLDCRERWDAACGDVGYADIRASEGRVLS